VAAALERTDIPGVYKRGRGYVVTYRDHIGTPRKKAAPTKAAARDLKAFLTADIRRGEYRPQSRISFSDYACEWIDSYQGRTSRGIRPETLDDYRADLEHDAIPFFGRRELAAIEPRDLKRFAAHLAKQGLAPGSVRNTLAPVRALFATAYEDGLIRANPAARIRLAQPQIDTAQEIRKALTPDELRRLLDALPAQWRLMFELLAHTGLRISEAVALRWDDLDLNRRRLVVRRRLYRGRIDTPKSRYGSRTIPLSPGLATALKEHCQKLGTTATAATPVFPSEAGGYIDRDNLRRRILKPAATKTGLGWVGFHTFRHTCATTLFNNGLNAKQVQHWLGHHSPAFTLATYIHLLPDDLPTPDFLDQITTPTQPQRPTKPPDGDRVTREAHPTRPHRGA
jgi:integrase